MKDVITNVHTGSKISDMSSSKKKIPNKDPMFDRDPVSGKLIPLPMYSTAPSNLSAKKSSEKKEKRKMELKPLHLMFGTFTEPETKLRKTDSSNIVRKGLFTMPKQEPSLNKRNSVARKNLNNKKSQMKKKNNQTGSPLLNMEEVEEELLSKKISLRGYPFKSPSKPVINFMKNHLKSETKQQKINIPEVIIEEPTLTSSLIEMQTLDNKLDEPKTPDSASSTEFLKLEGMFCDEMRDISTESPISSMCNLLSDTGLESIKKTKMNSRKESNIKHILINIKNIIDSEQMAFNHYKSVHEANLKKLSDLLCAFEKQDSANEAKTPDKENISTHNRRSVRLQKKSPLRTNNDKLLVSPSILKSGDLRKSTLKKNLEARNHEIQNQSPRTRKAFDLYNSLREKQSILLETPKSDRKALGETPTMARYISMKVQSQCLLLQDTPIHK
ncbi:hypothetical protein JTB14_037379 [Gonioctena quinquepunctata]|nr:hypothetical protein JTB14_037379 [Gonioctena quinquepunctata]